MDPTFAVTLSEEQFHQFYRIHRELFQYLVIPLSRDPKESMRVLALWLLLERMGYSNVIGKIHSSISHVSINGLADEAVTCLNCINTSLTDLSFEDDDDLPLMHKIIDKNISLKMLYENKVWATQGVAKVLKEVCERAFGDIIQEVNKRVLGECDLESQQVQGITSSKDLEGDKSNVAISSNMKLDEVNDISRNLLMTWEPCGAC